MDVTKNNFMEALTFLKTYLPAADFVALDLEFSGLGEIRPSQLDTPALRYDNASADAEDFPPLQFGISIFKKVKTVKMARDEDGDVKMDEAGSTNQNGVKGAKEKVGKPLGDEGKFDEVKADEVKTDEVKADEVKADEVKADEVKADVVKADEVKAGEGEVDEKALEKAQIEKEDGIAKVEKKSEGGKRGSRVLRFIDDSEDKSSDVSGARILVGDDVQNSEIGQGKVATAVEEGEIIDKKIGEECGEKDGEWEWRVIPFNFNIYPKAVYYPSHSRYPLWDRVFKLQSSTVQFLTQHGFDFMKVFACGVSWVSEEVEEKVRETVMGMKKKVRRDLIWEVGKGDRKVVRKYRDMIDGWLQKLGNDTGIKMFPLPKTPLQRRLVYQMIDQEYAKIYATGLVTYGGKELKLVAFEDEKEAARTKEQDLVDSVEEEVSKAVGFRYVIDALRQSKVPIVAHNAILDLIKMHGNFVERLPAELGMFKRKFQQAFPHVYDTRWVLTVLCGKVEGLRVGMKVERARDKHRSISEMIAILKKVLEKMGKKGINVNIFAPTSGIRNRGGHCGKAVMVDEEEGILMRSVPDEDDEERDRYSFGRYCFENKERYAHEAGFDALETGTLFALLLQIAEIHGENGRLNDAHCNIFGAKNKICLGSCGGYRYIDLDSCEDDEANTHLEKRNAVVISGEIKEDVPSANGYVKPSANWHAFKRMLHAVTSGTEFEAEKSSYVVTGPHSILAVLEKADGGRDVVTGKRTRDGTDEDRNDLESVIERGKQVGLVVEHYKDAIRDVMSKRRKLA